MRFRILGTLVVTDDAGRPVPLAAGRARALTIRLLLARGQVVPADRLIDELWDGRPPATARASLWNTVTRVRRALSLAEPGRTDSRLTTSGGGYQLDVDSGELDAWAFERELGLGRERLADRDPDGAARVLRGALELWRGPALADFRYAEFAAHEATRLDELRLEALEECFEADIARGHHEDVLADLEALTLEQPLRERFWEQLMLARYRCGRQADALDAFQTARRRLVDELGIEPGSRLRTLHEAMLQQDPALDGAGNRENTGAVARHRDNIPTYASTFIGREREMTRIAQLLQNARLVTLTGAGGVGKTRVALEAASNMTSRFGDGVWLVELASLDTPELIAPAIADVLAIREDPAPSRARRLVEHLRHQELLLVIDNCEHVLAACAQLVDELARACPDLVVIATSREPLHIDGEHVLRISSLGVPSADEHDAERIRRADGVRLFVERLSLHRSETVVTDDELATVAAICRRLDGIPLAIELAAARTSALSIEDVLNGLDDRFALLTSGSRAALPRQQTLRALLDWSFHLLDQGERWLLSHLSVFAGSWTIDTVSRTAPDRTDVLDLITALVDKSLVQVDDRHGVRRYRLLETVRQYAAEALHNAGPEAERRARAAHLDAYLDLARDAAQNLRGPQQLGWLARLRLEDDNLRTALSFSLEPGVDPSAGLQLVNRLRTFWEIRGRLVEGGEWTRQALARTGRNLDSLDYAAGLLTASHLANLRRDHKAVIAPASEALAIGRRLGDARITAEALRHLGEVSRWRGDTATAQHQLADALGLARSARDRHLEGRILNILAQVTEDRGDRAASIALEREALALFRALGDEHSIAGQLSDLAFDTLAAGDAAQARTLLEEALVYIRRLDDDALLPYVLSTLAIAARDEEPRSARDLLLEAVSVAQRNGDRGVYVNIVLAGALLAQSTGHHARAATLHGALQWMVQELGPATLDPIDRELLATSESELRATMGDAAYDAARSEGSRSTWNLPSSVPATRLLISMGGCAL